jgi:hypothetical protein
VKSTYFFIFYFVSPPLCSGNTSSKSQSSNSFFLPVPPRPALARSHPTHLPTLSRTPHNKRPLRMYYNSRTSLHHHAMREDLYNFVQYSSERPKPCEAEVLQYYRQFLHLSNPLVHAHCLTDKQRDTEFWYGFHPDDCAELLLHLRRQFPWWPRGTLSRICRDPPRNACRKTRFRT